MSTQQGSVSTTCLHPVIAILQRSDTRQVLVWATAALEEPDLCTRKRPSYSAINFLPKITVCKAIHPVCTTWRYSTPLQLE